MMGPRESSLSSRGDRDSVVRPRFLIPSWLLSVVLHAILLLVLAATVRFVPQGAAEESSRAGGIVIKRQQDDREVYQSSDEFENSAQSAATNLPDDLFSEQPPVDPTLVLPAPFAAIGAGPQSTELSDPSRMTTPNGSRPSTDMGAVRTGVFGVAGEGHKFVYVFDRSGSMGGSQRSALASAKAELLASLQSLGDTHQFQIVFYNEQPKVFLPDGRAGRLVFANAKNRARAQDFVAAITADGATQHEPALMMALKMAPDVIFFLTDADHPALSRSQLAKIKRLNGGRASLNTIEFGIGPPLGDDNFLVMLARQNGGQYVYVDIAKLRSGR